MLMCPVPYEFPSVDELLSAVRIRINTVLAARWSQAQATLYSGSETRNFASIDALIEQSTGAALPVAALFDWLVGKDTPSNGWTADLTRQAEGYIHARRLNPSPQTELRIVLDTTSR